MRSRGAECLLDMCPILLHTLTRQRTISGVQLNIQRANQAFPHAFSKLLHGIACCFMHNAVKDDRSTMLNSRLHLIIKKNWKWLLCCTLLTSFQYVVRILLNITHSLKYCILAQALRIISRVCSAPYICYLYYRVPGVEIGMIFRILPIFYPEFYVNLYLKPVIFILYIKKQTML